MKYAFLFYIFIPISQKRKWTDCFRLFPYRSRFSACCNSVIGVFSKTQDVLENPVSEENHEQGDVEYWASLDQDNWQNEWYTTETPLGTGINEISVGIAEHMIAYNELTGDWLPWYDYDGHGWDTMNEELELGWSEEEVDMFKRSTNVDGVLYTPFGNMISIEPGQGYYFTFQDESGEEHSMNYVRDGNGLLSNNVNLVLDDRGEWTAYWKLGGSENVDIDTLRVHLGDAPLEE